MPTRHPQRRSRGQVLIIFALTIFVFIGLCAIVVDVAWYWANNLRIQRAADAAALAGVVHLPGDVPTAISVARAEAIKNGYTNGVNGYTVTPTQDPANPRRLRVEIAGPVGTYFAHVIGVHSFPAVRRSRAEFILPVPMGSPEAYYGTFGLIRHPGGGITTPGNTSWFSPTSSPGTDNWTTPDNAFVADETPTPLYATKNSTTNPLQQYGNFGISVPGGVTIDGIEISIDALSSDNTGCRVRFEVSRNGGGSWSSVGSASQTNTFSNTEAQFFSPASGGSTYLWGLSSWNASHLTDANFRVQVEYRNTSTDSCAAGATTSLDHVSVRVHYSTFQPDVNITDPYGGFVNARGFWGTMHSPGSSDVDGDAYLPRWETPGSVPNDQYDPTNYYDYAVEFGPGTSNGEVWVYDPVFCAGGGAQYGTGDRWFSGNAAVSAFYDLYDTLGTPYDITDDLASPAAHVGTSGNLFQGIRAADPAMNGTTGGGVADCSVGVTSNQSDGRYWHLRWWRLASGLTGDTTYRLRTASTDPSFNTATGHNSFAIWSGASGAGTVEVHGLGAMEAFTPLNGGGASIFYLAQIDAIHAGKTVTINLWDPGDTGNLQADLRILIPSGGSYVNATMDYTSSQGSVGDGGGGNGDVPCTPTSANGVTSIRTNNGPGGPGPRVFNGCWLKIDVVIPTGYTASDPDGVGPGWWKIAYDMAGAVTDNSFDLTTWEVSIRGNPVHLVVP